jgi:HupE / UreJ protein
LGELGLGRWERVASILAFNLGIETMQLIVVAATMRLLLLSWTRRYSVLRIGRALFAGLASVGWIAERLLNVHSSVDLIVDDVAHHAVWIAGALFLMSLVCRLLPSLLDNRLSPPKRCPTDTQAYLTVRREPSTLGRLLFSFEYLAVARGK